MDQALYASIQPQLCQQFDPHTLQEIEQRAQRMNNQEITQYAALAT